MELERGEHAHAGEGEGHAEPEKGALVFDLDESLPEEILEVQQKIKQLAEKELWQWARFPVELPPSLTEKYTTDKDGKKQPIISFNNLFVAPSFGELVECAQDDNGDIKQLNSTQLQTVRQRGEFDVTSKNFPGQVHTWRVTQLLQKGTERSRDTMLNDMAVVLKLLIITAKNRLHSPFFSVSQGGGSMKRGAWQIMDCFVGMPLTTPGNLSTRLHEEHMKFLVAELNVTPSSHCLWTVFSEFVKDRWREGDDGTMTNIKPPLPPYKLQTAKAQEIDLRLFNRDIMRHCRPILGEILDNESRGWYIKFKDRLIQDLQAEEMSHKEISEEVNKAVKEEYLRRIFDAIEKSKDIEEISSGLGLLLVREARATLEMEAALEEAQHKLQQHSLELEKHLVSAYPVRSRIREWKQAQVTGFQDEYVRLNQWGPYESAIETCRTSGLDQAVYFLQRDLTFMRDREPVLMEELSKVRMPVRTFTFAQRIWFPGNWIVKRISYGETEVIPTVIVETPQQNTYIPSDPSERLPVYILEKSTYVQTSTKGIFWRWRNYFYRTWTWTWNAMFWLGIAMPWCGPLSFRALCYSKPFIPALELNHRNGTLQPQLSSKTETLRSRLVNLWHSVADSRAKFEAEPDTGFLGKGFTRHVNRFWNYVVKGALGSCGLVLGFAPLCVLVSVTCIAAAIFSPLWMPFLTMFVHLFFLIGYDFDHPGSKGNSFLYLFEAFVWRILIGGICQPIAALFTAGVILPVCSAAVALYAIARRTGREIWDAAIFNLVLKTQSRIPTQDTFVARRIAGPGLASNYFLQAGSEQILAAVESHMEHSELVAWEGHIKRLAEKPNQQFKQFTHKLLLPFSADLVQRGVYSDVANQTQDILREIDTLVRERKRRLATGVDQSVSSRIKLPASELKTVRMLTAQMLEDFYPDHVFSRLLKPNHAFWEGRKLQQGDWRGLATQVLTELFSSHFMTPLEDADTVFRLEINHVNLSRYVDMIADNNPHDDLDDADEIHTPQGDIDVDAPYFNIDKFFPLKTDITYAEFRRSKQYRRWPWSSRGSLNKQDLQKLQIPLPIMHPAFISMHIYNRENDQDPVNLDDHVVQRILEAAENTPYTDTPKTLVPPTEDSTPDATTSMSGSTVGVSHLAQQEIKFRGKSTRV